MIGKPHNHVSYSLENEGDTDSDNVHSHKRKSISDKMQQARPLFKSISMGEGSENLDYSSGINFDFEDSKQRLGVTEALLNEAEDFRRWQAVQRESKRVWNDPRSDCYDSQESELMRYRKKQLQEEGREL